VPATCRLAKMKISNWKLILQHLNTFMNYEFQTHELCNGTLRIVSIHLFTVGSDFLSPLKIHHVTLYAWNSEHLDPNYHQSIFISKTLCGRCLIFIPAKHNYNARSRRSQSQMDERPPPPVNKSARHALLLLVIYSVGSCPSSCLREQF
jgi:hypothetical protein